MTQRWLLWLGLALMTASLWRCEPQPAQEPQSRQERTEQATDTAPSEPTVDRDAPASDAPSQDARTREAAPESGHEPTQEASESPPPPDQAQPEQRPEQPPGAPTTLGLTYHRADGNRWVAGAGNIQAAKRLDISLSGTPTWLVAAATKGGTSWLVTLADGTVQGFRLIGQNVQPFTPGLRKLPPGMPPLITSDANSDAVTLYGQSSPKASTTSHSIPLSGDRLVFLEQGGDLVLWTSGKETARLAINALPDARILVDEKERLLVLTDPTSRYAHGVLGDAVEAASITMVSTQAGLQRLAKIAIPGQRVVEGIMPIWADLNGDGSREIIVTLSDASQGAQLVVYDEAGKVVATSPAIGSGNRWRNQVAVAPFGHGGQRELVDVFTPHIGGPTEFFQLQGNALQRVAQVTGYTAHVYGSRNLDLGLAGDFNNDGRAELLLPSQDRTRLGMIQRSANGATTLVSLPLNGQLSTNLAAVNTPQGVLVGAATDGQLHIWGR